MKVTKRQLRRIIKEEIFKEQTSRSSNTGWDNFTPEGEAEDEARLAAEDLPELLLAIDRNRKQATSDDDIYANDAAQLETVYDEAKQAFDAMETEPSSHLRNYMSRIDTAVREQIPENIYNWIIGA